MELSEQGLKQERMLFNNDGSNDPKHGSGEEIHAFEEIQKGFADQFELFFPDNLASKTIVVIPSLSLDQEVLGKVTGALHYEE